MIAKQGLALSRMGVLVMFVAALAAEGEHQVIPVYPGVAPGSESSTQQETVSPAFWDARTSLVRNVVRPTLTVYLPQANAIGTAVVVAPGGGFHFLSWESEGTKVAEWLMAHGVAAFVLKYRLIDTGATQEEFQEKIKALFASLTLPAKPGEANHVLSPAMQQALQLAGEDGRQAVKLVRERAAQWNLAPDRIGLMGFSAGAMVTQEVALHHTAETRPNFVAPIYGPSPDEITVPADAPPMFILCADDDVIAATGSARLYQAWHAAGKPVELHLYSKGGHGFGMQKRGLPVDHWIERFAEWMQVHGFMPAR